MRELRAIRDDAEVQRDQALARRGRRDAGSIFEPLHAAEILAMLCEPDLSDLEEVTPPLRVIQGGRG